MQLDSSIMMLKSRSIVIYSLRLIASIKILLFVFLIIISAPMQAQTPFAGHLTEGTAMVHTEQVGGSSTNIADVAQW